MAALQCELCGGKLQGKPGGIFECDSCGMEYTTEWAKAKIQEIKGTVKVEGTVEVTGTVKVEGTANIDGILARGFADCEDGNFHQAKASFREALKIDPENAEGHIGLAMCEVKCDTWDNYWAGLASQKYAEDSNFQRAAAGKGSTRFQENLRTYQDHVQARDAEKNAAEARGAEKSAYYTDLRRKYAPIRRLYAEDYFIDPDGKFSYDSYGQYTLRSENENCEDIRNLIGVSYYEHELFLYRADGAVMCMDCKSANRYKDKTFDGSIWMQVKPGHRVKQCLGRTMLLEDGTIIGKSFDEPELWHDIIQIQYCGNTLYALRKDGMLLSTKKDNTVVEEAGSGIVEVFFDHVYL